MRIIKNRVEVLEAIKNKQPIPVVFTYSRREFKARYGASALADTPEELQYQQQRSLSRDFTNHKPQSKYNY